MDEINLGKITPASTRKLQHFDKHLEDWIEADPSLAQVGLLIVGRQMHVDAGFLDLLGIDAAGRWVVIEIRKGSVRKESISQAIDYAACISEMDESELRAQIDFYLSSKETDLETILGKHGLDDERIFKKREMIIYVVGTGRDQTLKHMPNGLSYTGSPMNVIHFDVSRNAAHERVLVRQLTQLDPSKPAVANPKRRRIKRGPVIKTYAIERLMKLADQNGIGDEFRLLYDEATRHGLYPRVYRWSIMYAPPQMRTRCLICVWATSETGRLKVYIASRAFVEFYPMSEEEVVGYLGRDRWERYHGDQAVTFTQALAKLFKQIVEKEASP